MSSNLTSSPGTTPNIHEVPPGPGASALPSSRHTQPKRRVTLDENRDIDHPVSNSRSGSNSVPVPRSHAQKRQGTGDSTRSTRSIPQMVRRMTTGLLTPERKVGKAPTLMGSFKAAALSSWLNVLFVFVPIGWALHFVKAGGNDSISDTAVFVTNFIAIIPLAGLLGFATEEAALRLGQTLGGLLNATLGNVVELIVAILALVKCELAVVQSSLVGSILSNILLVLGMCFFAGGVRFAEQTIKATAAQLNASLLLIAVIAVLIPSAFHFSITTSANGEGLTLTDAEEGDDLLAMSHGVAILLLILYIGYLIFQMWSHADLYTDEETSLSTTYPAELRDSVNNKLNIKRKIRHRRNRTKASKEAEDLESATSNSVESPTREREGDELAVARSTKEDDDEEELPQMSIMATIIVMALDAAIVGVTAEWLVSSIDGLVETHPSLSREWVGLILLPIVGNAAEHFTAVSVSVKDKIDLSISVAVGSSIQIALFVIPVIQLLAWTIGKPMTLMFDPYESIVLFFSVLIVNQTLADGRSNWMEGLVLMMLYLIIAVSFWYYPGSNTATLLGCGNLA